MLHVTRLSSPPVLESPSREGLCAQLRSSGLGRSQYDRWSFFPGAPTQLLTCDASGRGTLWDASGKIADFATPQAALAHLNRTVDGSVAAMDPDAPPFVAGWVGYLGYDLGRFFEVLPSHAVDDLNLPLLAFTFHPDSLALDHPNGRWFRTGCTGAPDQPRLRRAPIHPTGAPGPFTGTHTAEAYQSAVATAINYIRAGDIFQVNLSHRLGTPLTEPPAMIFQRAQRVVPAWYGAYLSYGDFALVSNSPELFLQVMPREDGSRRVVTRPIKGTRPRAEGMERALRESLKDQAELNMIVDLERNDLGRVCQVGSVHVTQPRRIEAHPTVFHGAATVEGVLRPDVTLTDLLGATFPGGSVTGAPKIRAMQIIEQLEPVRRGPYCGAIGFISLSGHITFNLAIRTLVLTPERVHLNVGGGIVADSNPREEYEETLTKAQQLLAALGRA